MIRIGLIGDRSESVTAHRAIDAALQMCADVEAVWLHTAAIPDLESFDGLWCVPASPYADTDAALRAIQFARERGRPFLGSCGGFQHAIVEYARNVLGLSEADHAENNPQSAMPVIAPLACALVEQSGEIVLAEQGLIRSAYGVGRIEEGYHCSYGLNPAYVERLFAADLHPTAHDLAGEVRGVELRGHPFFVATLFQSERRALIGEMPPLVAAFVEAARQAR